MLEKPLSAETSMDWFTDTQRGPVDLTQPADPGGDDLFVGRVVVEFFGNRSRFAHRRRPNASEFGRPPPAFPYTLRG